MERARMRVSSLAVLLWQVVHCGRQLEFLATMDRHVDVSGEHAVCLNWNIGKASSNYTLKLEMNSTKCRESWTGPMKTDESEFGPIDERSRRLCQEFMIYNERPYSIDDCWDKCFQSEDCDAFYVDSEDQNCRLYRKGCSYSPYSPAAGEIDTFGSCLMNRVAFRQEFSWSTRTDGCFKYKVDRYSIIDKRDFLISGTEVPNNFLGEAKVTLLDPQENEIKSKTEKYSVVVRKENFVVFTQTDKKIYSPGQTVKYRVIVMRTDFSLYDGFCDVTLISAEGIQINKKENAALVKGFSQGEFELVDSATHGQWKIKVALDGYRQTYVTVFDIEEYHLPKFDITFDMPDVVRADSDLRLTACAKYILWQTPVTGFAEINVNLIHKSHLFYKSAVAINEQKMLDVDGCVNFDISVSLMIQAERDLWGKQFNVSLAVEEEGTGVIQQHQRIIDISKQHFEIAFANYRDTFKFDDTRPYTTDVFIKRNDNGKPAAGKTVLVLIDYAKSDFADYFYKKDQNYTTDENGKITVSFTPVKNSKIITIRVEVAPDNKIITGHHQIMVESSEKIKLKAWMEDQMRGGSYIRIDPPITAVSCDAPALVNVHYRYVTECDGNGQCSLNNDVSKFAYSIITAGKLYESKVLSRGSAEDQWDEADVSKDGRVRTTSGSFTLRLDIPIPNRNSVKLIATMTLEKSALESSLVTDISEIDFEGCLPFGVDASFDSKTAAPGDEVRVEFSAPGGSLCLLGVVDRGVYVKQRGQNTFSKKDIIDGIRNRTEFPYNARLDFTKCNVPPVPYSVMNSRTLEYYARQKGNSSSEPFSLDLDFSSDVAPPLSNLYDWESNESDALQPLTYASEVQHRFKRSLHDGSDKLSDYKLSYDAFLEGDLNVWSNLHIPVRQCEGSADNHFTSNSGIRPMRQLALQGFFATAEGVYTNEIQVRNYFPETWLWEDYIIPLTGKRVENFKVPGSTTTWIGNVMCLHPTLGVGILEPQLELEVSKNVFIDLTLPRRVVAGESFLLPVSLLIHDNSSCHSLELQIETPEGLENQGESNRITCACPAEKLTHEHFSITTQRGGTFPISVKMFGRPVNDCTRRKSISSALVFDGIERNLTVTIQGERKTDSMSRLICLKDQVPTFSETISLPSPSDAIEGSEEIRISASGDILGPIVPNIDALLEEPMGCGEQNLARLYPNVLVLEYLDRLDIDDRELEQRAIRNTQLGISRQIKFLMFDGSFVIFKPDPFCVRSYHNYSFDEALLPSHPICQQSTLDDTSTWLTSFAVKVLARADRSSKNVFVDSQFLLIKPLEWLKNAQKEDGCFEMVGFVPRNDSYEDPHSRQLAMNSFVLGNIIDATKCGKDYVERNSFYKNVIRKAMGCITEKIADETVINPHSAILALRTFAQFVNKCEDQDNDEKLWRSIGGFVDRLIGVIRKTIELDPRNTYMSFDIRKGSIAAQIEATGLMLSASTEFLFAPIARRKKALSALKSQNADFINFKKNCKYMISWLVGQRNRLGGWRNTQDTVAALEGILHYTQGHGKSNSRRMSTNEMTLLFDSQQSTKSLQIGRDNSMLLQQTRVTGSVDELHIKAEGKGCAMIQISKSYNVPNTKYALEGLQLEVFVRGKPNECRLKKDRQLTVCTRYKSAVLSQLWTNMVIVEVEITSGYWVDYESLKNVVSGGHLVGIRKYEISEDSPIIVFYLNTVGPEDICLSLHIKPIVEVSNEAPARISVYDYYDGNRKAVATYSPLCTDETWGNSGLELQNPNKDCIRWNQGYCVNFCKQWLDTPSTNPSPSAKCRQSVIFRGRRNYCDLSEQGRCKYGMCLTTLTYYRCECSDESFEPDAYGTSCQPRDKGLLNQWRRHLEDVDHCKTSNPCTNAFCINRFGGSYICECKQGYRRKTHEICEDVNECKTETNPCGKLLCVNTPGSYECRCPVSTRKVQIGNVLKCEPRCPLTHRWKEGLLGGACEPRSPTACTQGANPCGAGTCIPLKFGRHMCSCAKGFKLNENGKCVDIDECAEANEKRTRPCGLHQAAQCFNSEGSFNCICLQDMIYNKMKKTCECKNGTTADGRCKPECPENLDPIDRAVRGC